MKKLNLALRAAVLALVCFAASLPMATNCAKDVVEKNNDSWFSLATLSHVWGALKNNCEFSTNFTGLLTGPVKEKMEISVALDPKVFKPKEPPYTASMVHLIEILKNNQTPLVLEPFFSEGKWLWNNGVFVNQNKTSYYQVTYKGITYDYDYNEEKKSWEPTGKNRMSYLTYYSYLLENKQDLKPLIEHLVAKMIDYSPLTFSNPSECEKNRLTKTFAYTLLNEEKRRNKYVFYTGYQGCNDFWRDFVRAVQKALEGKRWKLERSKFENHTRYSSAREFIDKEYDYSYKFDAKKSKFLMSTNVALFGNSYLGKEESTLGQSSCNYFVNNRSIYMGGSALLEATKQLCKSLGLVDSNDSLKGLFEEYSRMSGKIKQTFLSPSYVDDFSYLSTFSGHPRTLNSDAFTKSVLTQIRKKQKLGENDTKFLTTGNVIQLLRTDPENNCFKLPVYPTPSCIDKDRMIKITDPAINTLQARLLHFSPLFFDPKTAKKAGRETLYYYSCRKDKIFHKKLRTKMDSLVEQMVKKARAKKTLKVDSLNSKKN